MKSFLIGSLPHTNVTEALDFSFSFDIPTLVTLPNLSESDLSASQLKANRLSQMFYCFREFCLRIKPYDLYKWQLLGPISAQKLGENMGLYMGKFNVISEELSAIIKKDALVFIDEPMLADGDDLSVFKEFSNVAGIHCCQKLSIETIASLPFDLIALDTFLYSDEELMKVEIILGNRLVKNICDFKGKAETRQMRESDFSSMSCGLAGSSAQELVKIKELFLATSNSTLH
jgi:hypothetical protein